MRRNNRIAGRICAAAALAITVTVCGIPALAPAASADSAVASAATRSMAPSSPQGPETRQVPDGTSSCVQYLLVFYPKGSSNVFTVYCNLPGLTGLDHLLYLEMAGCIGGLVSYGVAAEHAMAACILGWSTQLPYTQEQWCSGNDCPNAWSGGPWVDVYTGGTETGDNHQDFFLADVDNSNGNATGYYHLIFDGSGTWADQCIGDAYNNSGYADTSLDGCGNATGGGAGWGTNMETGTSGCPTGEAWFYDVHWKGYLAPANGAVNGSHFYLNDQSKVCFNAEFVS